MFEYIVGIITAVLTLMAVGCLAASVLVVATIKTKIVLLVAGVIFTVLTTVIVTLMVGYIKSNEGE